ncbi:MAG: exodeoxyribonuclease VII large subunit [Bacteroidota bacterium]
MAEQALSLLDLQKRIKFTIESGLDTYYWVVAEISELNVNYKGHCYMNLVQKDEKSDNILAKIRAIVWSRHYKMLSTYFKSQSKESLRAGLKVMLKVRVNYHEQYSLSLQVIDIDPTYTMGDVEKRRQEIIAKLEAAGITDMNKTLDLPLVIHNIAVISSDTAAGFGDFIAQIESNQQNYAFNIVLFRAAMQGEDTENSVTGALESIYKSDTDFDIVVIIRGGGAKTDLSWFDNYNIAAHVAQFPLPVFSGIGHERDATVTDMMAHAHLKTPTAVAERILDHNRGFEEGLDLELENLLNVLRHYLNNKSRQLNQISGNFVPLVKNHLNKQSQRLNFLQNRLHSNIHHFFRKNERALKHQNYKLSSVSKVSVQGHKDYTTRLQQQLMQQISRYMMQENHRIERLEDKIKSDDPARLLEKGFTLTSSKGKPVKSAKQLKKGDVINTKFIDGNIESEVR